MRSVLVLAALLLAGCTAPEEAEPEPNVIWSVCPQWIHGGQTWMEVLDVAGDATTTLDGNQTKFEGRHLDLYVVKATSDAPLTLRFFADGRQLQVHGDGAFPPSLRVDGEVEVHLFLSPATHGSEPAPAPLTIEAEGTGHLELEVQPWFRVCGST